MDNPDTDPNLMIPRTAYRALADRKDKRIGELESLIDTIPYRALLDLWMCSDPWPEGVDQVAVESWLDDESQRRGFLSIVEAYHNMPFVPTGVRKARENKHEQT